MVLGHRSSVIQMKTIAARYPERKNGSRAIVPDFHSVRQALNVASADQRVLVVIAGSDEKTGSLRTSLRSVSNDERIVGRFHFDFDSSDEWHTLIHGLKTGSGILVIRPGKFGLDGTVMNQLPLDAAGSDIIDALLAANRKFAETTAKKVYSSHVAEGFRRGIYFDSVVPYGEDRDGDGRIDHQPGRPDRRPGGRGAGSR